MKKKKTLIILLIIIFFFCNFSYASDDSLQIILDDYNFTNEEQNSEVNTDENSENTDSDEFIENQNNLEEIENQNSEEVTQENIREGGMYSESAILIESKTGKVLFEKNIHDRKYPASTTKVLTAIIAIEKCNLLEKATASETAIGALKNGYTKADIQVGETFTIEELLNVLILQSANEAASIIAEHISGSTEEFAKLMNEKAKEIGCIESNFVNPNGVHDENHYSSAYDLAMIARYAMKNETFRKLVVLKECSLPHTEFWGEEQVLEHGERNFKNTNQLLNPESRYYYKYANGIKAGFTTPAKNCLIASSNKDGFEVISVVLHAESTEDNLSARYIDTINLFEYGYNNYNIEDLLKDYNEEEPNTIESSADTINEEIIREEGINLKSTNFELIEIIAGVLIIIIVIIVSIIRKKKNNKF